MESAQPEISPYDRYRSDPTPDNLNLVVDGLKPVISYHLANLGSADDPIVRNKARIVASQAVKTYDPSRGIGLPTYVSSQMPQLRRFRRQAHQVIKVPERILLDSFQLSQKEKEFVDIHDRDPDIVELADFSKIPVHRIKKIRMMSRPTPTEGALGDAMTGDSDDFSEEATDYIHRDSDRVDRKILEWRTGHGGSDILTPLEIAARLKISPSQVSRRATRLTYKINQMVEDLRSLST